VRDLRSVLSERWNGRWAYLLERVSPLERISRPEFHIALSPSLI
jgi:hypothetical protein